MFDARYKGQIQLLLRCLPDIFKHTCFGLKGGTALNLFLRDLPRISVDIDLTYLPLNPRLEALSEITESLTKIKADLEKHIPGSRVQEKFIENFLVKLLVATKESIVKIEPNLVFRGFINDPQIMDLCARAQDYFQISVTARTMSRADLYGGKICAALDRQHPRDLFDIKILLENEGITPEIRRAFVVYLAGHNRPMSELLSPCLLNIEQSYRHHFLGMSKEEVSMQDLLKVQAILPKLLVQALNSDEKEFLLSMKRGQPKWDCLGIEHLDQFPSLKWKLINIQKMDPDKHKQEIERLIQVLG